MSVSDDGRELSELFQELLDAYEEEATARLGEGSKEREQLGTTISQYRERFNNLLDRLVDPQSTGKLR
jgi:hypothetical protein